MKKLNKLLIAAAAVIVGIAVGIVLVYQSGGEYINEQEVRAVVTDRYAGDIDNISMSDDERFYIVNLKNGEYQYEIKVDRDDSSIENIVTEKVTQPAEDTAANSGEKPAKDQKKSNGDKKAKEAKNIEEKEAAEKKEQEKKEKEETADTLITENEAKQIAFSEVGGEFVHATLNENTHPKQYQIIQLVDDDDEGALVTVDAVNGEALKVLWFAIDFNNIADIEAFAKQLQDYNAQYQNNHYIEFDTDDSDDDDDDDDDDD